MINRYLWNSDILINYMSSLNGGAATVPPSVSWNYTGQNSPDLNTLTRCSEQPYYFKMRVQRSLPFPGTIAGSTYWGPLYLYPDGSYRSGDSIEAIMMFQKSMSDFRPHAFKDERNLDALRKEPRHSIITLLPRHGVQYPIGTCSSTNPLPGYSQYWIPDQYSYFGWRMSTFGDRLDLVEPVSEEVWIAEQTGINSRSLYNLATIKRLEKRRERRQRALTAVSHMKQRRDALFGLATAADKLPHHNINATPDTDGNQETIMAHQLGFGSYGKTKEDLVTQRDVAGGRDMLARISVYL